jgi:hypothetical protein
MPHRRNDQSLLYIQAKTPRLELDKNLAHIGTERTMKVFISWSGDLSRELAVVLRDWIPSVIQAVEPYVSSEDIDKGTRWSTDISVELEGSSFGIICVTPGNVEAPWINFEAGALSKSFDQSNVTPFLLGVKRSEVKGPLLQFQNTVAKKDDVFKLLKTLNRACGNDALEEDRLSRTFDVWWPQLEDAIARIEERLATPDVPGGDAAVPSSEVTEILEEILDLARSQQKILSSPEQFLPPGYLQAFTGGPSDIEPGALVDLRSGIEKLNRALDLIDTDLTETPWFDLLDRAYRELSPAVRFILRRAEQPHIRRWSPGT